MERIKPSSASEEQSLDLMGSYAGLLALTEIGVGAFLHAFHVPLSGSFLSLHQIFILSLASKETPHRLSPFYISLTTAALKSLAPIGKKLTPMLALTVQGLLFNFGTLLGGRNLFGLGLGAVLASLWGFIQPLLLYSFILGHQFFVVLGRFVKDLPPWMGQERLLYAFSSLVLLKATLALLIAVFTPKLPFRWISHYLHKMSHFRWNKKEAHIPHPLLGALKDLKKPSFLIALSVMGVLYYSVKQDGLSLALSLMRTLTIGYLTFFFIRWIPMEKLSKKLEGKTHFLAHLMQRALQKTREG